MTTTEKIAEAIKTGASTTAEIIAAVRQKHGDVLKPQTVGRCRTHAAQNGKPLAGKKASLKDLILSLKELKEEHGLDAVKQGLEIIELF